MTMPTNIIVRLRSAIEDEESGDIYRLPPQTTLAKRQSLIMEALLYLITKEQNDENMKG